MRQGPKFQVNVGAEGLTWGRRALLGGQRSGGGGGLKGDIAKDLRRLKRRLKLVRAGGRWDLMGRETS